MNKLLFRSLAVLLFILLYQVGDLNALRQGTEGFYLQVAKESFEKHSFLTPIYQGQPHWSKPPLQFWLTWPLFSVFGKASLTLARTSIALFTFTLLYLISLWVKRHFRLSLHSTLIYFAGTLAFLKYGRIFMMEMPLALLSTYSAMLYYDFTESKEREKLYLSAFALALATLVKGPVAIIMVAGSLSFYFLLSKSIRENIRPFSLYLAVALFLSSIWFVLSIYFYGQEFINYFFLRENMGKFTAHSYPIRSVILGFFVYSLPWSLATKDLYFDLKKKIEKRDLFLISCALFSLVLWIIPSQRSFHYAIPAIPYFIILLITRIEGIRSRNWLFIIFSFTIFLVTLIALLFAFIFSQFSFPAIPAILTASTAALSIYYWGRPERNHLRILSLTLSIFSLWVLLIPSFVLPLVPSTVVDTIHGKEIGVYFRKPFFVEEAIESPITILGDNEIPQNRPTFIICSDNYHSPLLTDYKKEQSWPIWKRGIKSTEVVTALKTGDLSLLEENLTLYVKLP